MATQAGLQIHSTGAFLREARINSNISLSEASAYLRIHVKYLKLIEGNCYEDLPGPTYAIGFIRSYAEYLGVDAKILIDQYKEETANVDVLPGLEFPLPTNLGWFPSGKAVLICMLLSLFALVGWFVFETDDLPGTTDIPLPPGYEATADKAISKQKLHNYGKPVNVMAKEDILSYKSSKSKSLMADTGNKKPNQEKNSSEKTLVLTPEHITPKLKKPFKINIKDESLKRNYKTATKKESLESKLESNIGNIYGEQEKNSRILIVAESDSWIQVLNNNKKIIISRMFRAGDSYNVPNKSGLILLTGNAGGLKITIDGKSVPKLGSDGAILNNVRLDIELLNQGRAVN